jgi:3-phosphoshikimate 1-carboxyvinyltransferase
VTDTEDDFAAPIRIGRAEHLWGALYVPSDKSIAHRALLFNAMAEGGAEVIVDSPGADVRSTAAALAKLDALIELRDGSDRVRYQVRGGGSPEGAQLGGDGDELVDCGNSGTSMRLLSGALASRLGKAATLRGDASLSSRPMERVATPLRAMGAAVETEDGHAPISVHGRRPLRAIDHILPVASAQVLGAISLAALATDGRTTITSPGPTRDHTERLLTWLGASIRREGDTTEVEGPGRLTARSMTVPGDISSAAAWLVAGALHSDADLTIENVSLNPSRMAIVDVLREMGARITYGTYRNASDNPEPVGQLQVGSGPRLRSIALSGARVAELIDELPLLSVAMAAADGISEVRDAGELRLKESDRIKLVVQNLRAIGADAEELPDGWRVRAGKPRSASIVTGGDHRIAIAFAVAAATGVALDVVVDDPACVAVSYPGFWQTLAWDASMTRTPASGTAPR